ncbi:hypothetical protein [Chitinivorax sp. B]|uniref:hypothetical protein n=1 Tax=Chitinivorax sp. B TaxID=2502235 RepID=UPI0010F82731|nr:hypothetical protein [Chitinivorax sp. B]
MNKFISANVKKTLTYIFTVAFIMLFIWFSYLPPFIYAKILHSMEGGEKFSTNVGRQKSFMLINEGSCIAENYLPLYYISPLFFENYHKKIEYIEIASSSSELISGPAGVYMNDFPNKEYDCKKEHLGNNGSGWYRLQSVKVNENQDCKVIKKLNEMHPGKYENIIKSFESNKECPLVTKINSPSSRFIDVQSSNSEKITAFLYFEIYRHQNVIGVDFHNGQPLFKSTFFTSQGSIILPGSSDISPGESTLGNNIESMDFLNLIGYKKYH